jgi:hypothetical protein
MRQKNMVMGPMGFKTKNGHAGEGQQKFGRQTEKASQSQITSWWLAVNTEIEESL